MLVPRKTFLALLKDGRTLRKQAESYRREGDQYVFDGTESGEVEFIMADHVISITVESPRPPGRIVSLP